MTICIKVRIHINMNVEGATFTKYTAWGGGLFSAQKLSVRERFILLSQYLRKHRRSLAFGAADMVAFLQFRQQDASEDTSSENT
jgi:hypothetical protein